MAVCWLSVTAVIPKTRHQGREEKLALTLRRVRIDGGPGFRLLDCFGQFFLLAPSHRLKATRSIADFPASRSICQGSGCLSYTAAWTRTRGPTMELNSEVHSHPHKVGHAWLDIVLASSALALSIASIIISIQNESNMRRLVTANSWPCLRVFHGNQTNDGEAVIHFNVRNVGVGSAYARETGYNL